MDRQAREADLHRVLAEMKRDGQPVSLEAFLERAGMSRNSRGYLHREFNDIYNAVARAAGSRTRTTTDARTRSENTQLRRENSRLARLAEELQTAAAAERVAAEKARASGLLLVERVAFLERCLEAMIARAVEVGVDTATLEEVLKLAQGEGRSQSPAWKTALS